MPRIVRKALAGGSKPAEFTLGAISSWLVFFLAVYIPRAGSEDAAVHTLFTMVFVAVSSIFVLFYDVQSTIVALAGIVLSCALVVVELRYLSGLWLRASVFVHVVVWLLFGTYLTSTFIAI